MGWQVRDDKVVLDAQESVDEDGEIIEYKWELGDGQIVYGSRLEYEYEQPGEYKVVLAVTDDVGQVAKSETTIRISRFNSTLLIQIGIIILAIILAVCIILLIRQRVVSKV